MLNLMIVYTFSGRFEEALAVTSMRWVLLYLAIYWFAAWDSYRIAVSLNKYALLADRSGVTITRFKMNAWDTNYLDRRNPWVSLLWSALSPGLGHLYCQRFAMGFFILLWWLVVTYYSHLLEVFSYTLLGDFSRATAVADPEWLLFMPSIYCFAFFDAYVKAVEINKLFDREQADHLKKNCCPAGLLAPLLPGEVKSMYVLSCFKHSLFLELAITDLKMQGIKDEKILAAPLDKPAPRLQAIDSIHQADEASILDSAFISGAFCAVLGTTYGFVWTGGPLLWGLIGLVVGTLFGGVADYLYTRRRLILSASKSVGVILIVACEENEAAAVEEILRRRAALGLTRVNK